MTVDSLLKAANIVVYTKNSCPACERAKGKLKLAGVPFTTKNIDSDLDAMDEVVKGGYRAMPVVLVDGVVFDLTKV